MPIMGRKFEMAKPDKMQTIRDRIEIVAQIS